MEGLLDHSLRDVITRVGGVDRCVSEFIRITDQLLPVKCFHCVWCPSCCNGSRTAAGTPVRPQLLGSATPTCLAENAARLATLNPAGIDLNFGCPAQDRQPPPRWRRAAGRARTGPRHRGSGAPRRAGAGMPVSAKMRLGRARRHHACWNARQAIADAGADELVVHARTKLQGYKPPPTGTASPTSVLP